MALFALLFWIVLVVCGPLATLWSVNTLFHLAIPYTGWTWLAAALLLLSLRVKAS